MTRRMVIVTALTLVLGVAAAWAHEGHTHKVMGTVSMVHENHLMVQTKDGKTVTITLNEKTSILRGKQKQHRSQQQPGPYLFPRPIEAIREVEQLWFVDQLPA